LSKVKTTRTLSLVIIILTLGIVTFIGIRFGWIYTIIIGVIFLVPGRFQNYYYRDFYSARKLLISKNFEESIELFNKFLEYVQSNPKIKILDYLSLGIYTRDIEAMTYNNIGVGLLHLSNCYESEEHYKKAIAIDPAYPLPHYNLAIVWIIKNDNVTAKKHFKVSEQLGFKGSSFDKFVIKAKDLYSDLIVKSE